ncbi:hypothetical protein QOZ95_003197 [Paenibacillus brasilensis]|uniref:Uncharacterized protein n=1 Tax=Paenibacillus brasilensis TaxID=128574 RepID=A0ABU0L033_9BACL|nr:hypothetical protein [Paenibacillus brasilensis]
MKVPETVSIGTKSNLRCYFPEDRLNFWPVEVPGSDAKNKFGTSLSRCGYGVFDTLSNYFTVCVSYAGTGPAREPYEAFLLKYPGLEKRIPQYHVASYIGVSPVSLSRLLRSELH